MPSSKASCATCEAYARYAARLISTRLQRSADWLGSVLSSVDLVAADQVHG
jgi:hypothetical protein